MELTKIRTTEFEKDELLKAGLGEKEIAFDDINISAEEVHDVLIANFPGLKPGEGFISIDVCPAQGIWKPYLLQCWHRRRC